MKAEEKFIDQCLAELEQAGRDRAKIKRALKGILLRLELSVGADEWAEEYRLWLLDAFCSALVFVREQAVKAEDFEWAIEIDSLLLDVQTDEQQSILTPNL